MQNYERKANAPNENKKKKLTKKLTLKQEEIQQVILPYIKN